MGRDLIGRDPLTDRLLERAGEATGEPIARICLRGPGRRLAETRVLQPAMTAICLGLHQKLVDAGMTPHCTAGHSLGELPALVAAGMAEPLDVVALAAERGRLMGEAAVARDGAMWAVTGVDHSVILDRVEAGATGIVAAAAVNSPNQVTLSGDGDRVAELAGSFRSFEGAKVTELKVSGAWHSEHMRPALGAFRLALDGMPLAPGRIPLIANRDGRPANDPDTVRERLAGQLVRPIRWDLVMQRLADEEVTDIVEIGPGKVLRGLSRLNLPGSGPAVHNVSDLRSLGRVVDALSR